MQQCHINLLTSHLKFIKTMRDPQQVQQQYRQLLGRYCEILGDNHPQMANLYFDYAHHILVQIQSLLLEENFVVSGFSNRSKRKVEYWNTCEEYFLLALHIYEQQNQKIERNKQPYYPQKELLAKICTCKWKLADFYHITGQFSQASQMLKSVIELRKKLYLQPGREQAELHYLLANCNFYQNNFQTAMLQFTQAIKILIAKMEQNNKVEKTTFPIPTSEEPKVERYAYLPKSTDCESIMELKEVISCILDKMQDISTLMKVKEKPQEGNGDRKKVYPFVGGKKMMVVDEWNDLH